METNQAAENLQVIRTLMERSALYRRALAPVMLVAGVIGIAAGLFNQRVQTANDFVILWCWAAIAAIAVTLLLVRRQALKEKERFWSPPTRRIAQAMLLPLFAGLAITLCSLRVSAMHLAKLQSDLDFVYWLPPVWAILYGCALHAAGFFTPNGVRILGWIFSLCGMMVLALYLLVEGPTIGLWITRFFMGATFGGLHLAAGVYLYFTEQRKNVA